MDDSVENSLISTMGEDGYMQMKTAQAMELISADLGRFCLKSLRRVQLYWLGDLSKPTSIFGLRFPLIHGINAAKLGLNLGLLGGALIGLFAYRDRVTRLFFVAAVVFLPLPYYVTHVAPKYRAFVDPCMCLLFTGCIVLLLNQLCGHFSVGHSASMD